MDKDRSQDRVSADGGRPGTGAADGAASDSKKIVTIRLDVDVLAWFKSGGPGYQTRVNKLLRDYMNEHAGSHS